MKKFSVLAIALTFSGLAVGNTVDSVFSKNSKLPNDVKVLVLSTITSNCPTGVSAYGLKELSTEAVVTAEGETQYTTLFNTTYYPDRMHPAQTVMQVKSAKAVTETGTRYEISSVESTACDN